MRKTTMCYLLGVVCGAGAAIISLKEYYYEKSENAIRDMEKEIRAAKSHIAEINEKRKQEVETNIAKGREIKDYIDYTNVEKAQKELDETIEKSLGSVMKKEEEAETIERRLPPKSSEEREEGPSEGPAEEPYIISANRFANERPYYDKVTLVYFAGDGTLCYEDSYEEADINVGVEFVDHFGDDEPNVCYVRNEKSGCDYEILLEEGSFSDLDS